MEQINPGQVKKMLKQLKQRQEQYLYFLGQLAYKAGEQGKLEDPEMIEAYRTLKEVQGQAAQGESTLEQYRAAKEAAQRPRCPYCSATVLRGAVFCANCGVSLATPPQAVPSPAVPPMAAPPMTAPTPVAAPTPPSAWPVPPATGMVCPGCGASLDEDALFCGNCGARVEAKPAQLAAPAAPPAPPLTPSPPVPAATVVEAAAAPKVEEQPASTSPESPAPSIEGEAASQTAEGEKPSEPEEQSSMEATKCPGCGIDISDPDMRFCPDCGSKVGE